MMPQADPPPARPWRVALISPKEPLYRHRNGIFIKSLCRHDLALAWNPARWRALAAYGFTPNDVAVVRRNGCVVAAAGVWA